MRLKNIGLRFRGKYKKLNGQNFYGQLLDLPDTSRVSNFLTARRYLRVHVTSPVSAGEIVVIDNQKYIVANHGTGFFRNPIYEHFKLFEVDKELDWFTKTESKNAITGVMEKSEPSNQGTCYVSVQPKSGIEDSIRIETPQHILVTSSAVKVDDVLGTNWIVTKVDPVLGVYVVEVKEG